MVLPLDEPLVLESGTIYNVQAGAIGPENHVRICMSGNSPNQSSFLIYPELNQLYYTTKTPMVRMQVFPIGSTVGCTDELAANYNADALLDDDSCNFPGCTDLFASNYDPSANFEDDSCLFEGCTNPEAINFDPNATVDDGSCIIVGCTDPEADNYNPEANQDDGSCLIAGCTDPEADNYNPNATEDDGSCIFVGCTDENALNFDPTATEDDGSCEYDSAQFSVFPTTGCAPFDVNIQNITDVVGNASCVFTLNGETIQDGCLEEFDYTVESTGSLIIEYTYTVGDFVSTDQITIESYPSPAVPELSYDEENNLLLCT